jgi:hypothetical protein
MEIRGSLVLALAAVLAGCGSQMTVSGLAMRAAEPGQPYRLYTHCGIQWARIGGVFWRATHPLSDGNGTPPPGWGNPFQAGRLTFSSRTRALFSSPAGSVTFKRTERTRPPVICS